MLVDREPLLCVLFVVLGLMARDSAAQTPVVPDGIVTGYANSRLPAWLRLDGEERVRLEGLDGVSFEPTGNTHLLQRLRLSIDVAPKSWLTFFLQAQDSRVYFSNISPAPASQKDPMDLRLGYLQLGNPNEGPVSLMAGRQSIRFGEGRLVSVSTWSNVGRTFDGLRVNLRYRKIRVDAFSGAFDQTSIDGFDRPTPGQHFHGVYASMDKIIPDATIEPYLFWRLEHAVPGELTKPGKLDTKTTGLRWVGKLPRRFDYGLELAVQHGRQANERAAAWAGHWILGRTLSDTPHRPRLFAELNRASGDKNPGDGVHGAFDPLFPSTHDKFGLADQFGWTNIVHARSGIQYRVREGLTLAAAYNSFWLATAVNSNESHLGQEADIQGQWNLSRHTLVDFGLGHIFPGEFLRKTGRGTAYNCVFLGVTQRF